jgi:hypothetical protein
MGSARIMIRAARAIMIALGNPRMRGLLLDAASRTCSADPKLSLVAVVI